MESRGKRIRKLRKEAGLSQDDLALEISRATGESITRGAIGNWELDKGISTENLKALSRLLGASIDWIETGHGQPYLKGLTEDGATSPKGAAPVRQEHEPKAVIGRLTPLWHRVKAYGHAMGGDDGEFVLNGNEIGDILAPPSLVGVPDAYAVYAAGDSMVPRYFAGEIVFVHPRLPIKKGDFVVAQIRAEPGEPPLAYIKQFVSKNDKTLRLQQYNPEKYLSFPTNKIVSIHKIIPWGG